jgi:hypothetical protein
MANKPDERLIILLPPDLLEEVRRAAETEDLSVSQIVRRAIRNELKAITQNESPETRTALEHLGRIFLEARKKGLPTTNAFYGDPVPGVAPKPASEKTSTTETATIVRKKPRFRI